MTDSRVLLCVRCGRRAIWPYARMVQACPSPCGSTVFRSLTRELPLVREDLAFSQTDRDFLEQTHISAD